jgi:3-dehydroquinate synthase
LPKREVTSGCCEIVKQGVISSRRLFDQTMNALRNLNSNAHDLSSVEFEGLIAAHCAFKASVVRNDEREARHRTDLHSRRILNFGHTAGHAIESVTSYRRFRHGEAVGIGMIIAGLLSRNLGLLADDEFELLTEAIELCGKLPPTDDLDSAQVLKSIVHDKKKVAGYIQWVLLEGIGKPTLSGRFSWTPSEPGPSA